MAKRPRNLWRRPNSSFRLGQKRPTDANLDEQRLTLYLPAFVLDWAEQQANQAGVSTVQIYCAGLLRDAIEEIRGREQLAQAEARTGALQGFRDVTDDPEYLAEWSASAAPRNHATAIHRIEDDEQPGPQTDPNPMSDQPSPAAVVVLRHSASGSDDPSSFLASIRRGESVTEAASGELLQALNALEVEYRDARSIDRRVAYALHRLAFEAQILHSDAWPGSLDAETVNLIRVVQEAVDRVLSGEDIRYYPSSS
ncbi:hypothetical protein P12x_001345 [Tundrisphaera lichenicola]|uniref:hypothetical protein n=1 Tax=Tundrisphaera lichenicola TaxID=2029860 RepID=UPI003EB9F720